ncbi:MAG: NUDIX domain-containing protein [Clostridiales bacterium]|nr:NUDIX domain-containing protein [Clostridiales bacterium]
MEKCGLKLQQVRKEGDTNNQGICDTAIRVLTADQYFAAWEASLAAKGNPAELWENLTAERKLLQQIKAYKPWNRQEELDQEEFIRLIENSARTGDADIFSRENRKVHLTASAWTVNKDRTKALMAYHNIYDSWSWLGGHADGERDLLSVAIREVKEESGVKAVIPLDENIFSIEILTVEGHEKKGDYVPSHLHFNVTYLLEVDETENIYCKADENSGVAWYPLDEAVTASAEPWFRQRIYSKLNAKLREYHV